MPTVIGYSDYYIAENTLSIDEFVVKLSDEFVSEWGNTFVKAEIERDDLVSILKNTGTQRVGVEDCRQEPQRFCELFDRYLSVSNVQPEEIDCIIYTRGNPIVAEINIPYYLQKQFQLPRVQIFSIEQECSASLLAIHLAQLLINSGSARRVLILSRNVFESYEKRLMGLFLVSDGFGLMELINGETGLTPVDFISTSSGNITKVQDFTLKASEVVEIGAGLIRALLKKNGLTIKDIGLIIPQNTNSSGWNIYSKQLDIAREQIFFDNFGGIGHLGDLDIIRNITDIRRKKLLSPGDLALAYALGTGTSWNASLLRMA
jgi:3-oxoacyl-[acyl-carrier-protein] synthase-3